MLERRERTLDNGEMIKGDSKETLWGRWGGIAEKPQEEQATHHVEDLNSLNGLNNLATGGLNQS